MTSSHAAWVRLVVLIGAADGVSAEWRQSLQTALVAQQNGDLVGAAPHYRAALKENPDLQRHAPVLTNLGLAVQAEGHVEEALAAFQGALSLTPEDPNAYFNLARAFTDSGEHGKAQQALRYCLALSPQDAEAYYDLGLSLLQQREARSADEGVEAVRACVALEPKDGKNWLALGDGLAAQKRWEESASAYTRACNLRPAHAPSWASLGNALEEQGSNADAEAHLRKAIALAEADGGAEGGGGGVQASWCLNLASMLRRADRMGEARTMYSSALHVEPTSVDAYMGLGRCHAPPTDSDSEGASRYLRGLRDTYGAALELQPDHAGAYTAIGEAMRMYGLQGGCNEFEGRGALDMYRQALALLPDNTCALTHVAFGDRVACAPAMTEELTMMRPAPPAKDGSVGSADGVGEDDEAAPAPTVATLSAPAPSGDETLAETVRMWRRNGLVVFPGLLDARKTEALLRHVRKAQQGNHTKDYTPVTRDNSHRCHKALPVDEAKHALEAIAQRLQPFLDVALGVEAPALLESGFMVTAPGASAQNFHRDVPPAVVARSSMTVSIQVSLVDTDSTQGSLEVIPGSQTFDPAVSDRTRAETLPKVRVAVPKGSVVVYALHTMHRGSSNTHSADRPFFFFTLTGNGLAPPGLAYTIEPKDVGKWEMAGGKLRPRKS